MRSSGAAALVALALVACGDRTSPRDVGPNTLSAGMAALVGADPIEKELVVKVARASGISEADACDELVSDALLAAGARERFGPYGAHHAESVARSRGLLEALRAEAEGKGPSTAEELAAATRDHWWELDRPVLRRTTHAVAVVKKAEDEVAARALAERVATAVADAHDADTFRRLAGQLGSGEELRVEDLDPVAEDGRVVNLQAPPGSKAPDRSYTPAFTAAVYRIPAVGENSGIVRTEFGFHVILLTEIIPAVHVPEEERRKRLRSEIVSRRFGDLTHAAIEGARASHPVDFERAAVELMEKVHVDR